MNIIKKLSLRHLKKNKNRSALTVLGITVSVVLMTALVVAASSFLHYYGAKVFIRKATGIFMSKPHMKRRGGIGRYLP